MKKPDISKLIFYVTLATVFFVIAFGLGFYSSQTRNQLHQVISSLQSDIKLVFEEKENLTKTRPKYFLQPARYDKAGVSTNTLQVDNDELVLIAGFFDDNNGLRLISRDGTVVARWDVAFSELFPDASHMEYPPKTDWNIDTHGVLAFSDGSVLFNFEYGGLAKLDRCGDVLWTLAVPAHHSVELAEQGGFWIPGRKFHPESTQLPYPHFQTPVFEDTIMRVSDNGELLKEISVPRLFFDNGLETLLTSTGELIQGARLADQEIVHVNKIAELPSDIADNFPLFEAGDLMLSLRVYNMVIVLNPVTEEIKWWQIGPWKRQHDPEFAPDGKIILFNNNHYFSALDKGLISNLDIPRISNVMEIDPVTRETAVLYGDNDNEELLSVIRGKLELLPKGGLLITEFEGGRILQTDAEGQLVWEYVNRYGEDEVAELTEARVYAADFFRVPDWSCPDPAGL